MAILEELCVLPRTPKSDFRISIRTTLLLVAAMVILASGALFAQVAAAPSTVPFVKKHIYSETANPRADIAAALQQARREHKRVILDFGGDWCGDCQVLDIYFHQSPNEELLNKNFVLVHVFIGHLDLNVDIAEKYGIPLKKGVPALAVVNFHGKVLYSQQTGEFEDMRNMNVQSVTDFLKRWKA
ncbi:thioredoxin family protein [Granulicella arctica]|uniref:Thiol:disulfide interchange protein n=1 Tax=Granulicella arctica TaxID=940613 RepID=A0A7Y9PD59_9BACT|nr:thioredoxin family protein [Granulicella arctica]NYF77753.1 thiol:disulfide interchange protein [Granulicella arctica]